MSTAALLLYGAASMVLFIVVMTLEGARRPGYDAAYHTGSELDLGPAGWIQRANFLLAASGFAAVTVGVERTLQTTAGAVLLGRWVGDLHPRDRGHRPGHHRRLITAYRRDAAYTGLVQRALIDTYWLWITALSLHRVTANHSKEKRP